MPQQTIFNQSTRVDGTGNVSLANYATLATNANFPANVFVFPDPAADEKVSGSFQVPEDYSSGANILLTWTAVATSGNVDWGFDYRAISGNDTESLDQSTFQEQVNATDAAPSAAHERNQITISLTDSNIAAGDTIEFTLKRRTNNDTMADDAILFHAEFDYTA